MRLADYALTAGAALLLALSAKAQLPGPVGDPCTVDTDCYLGCCGSQMPAPVCLAPRTHLAGEGCDTLDGCDCVVGKCTQGSCEEEPLQGEQNGGVCMEDVDCQTGCCASSNIPSSLCSAKGLLPPGAPCLTEDGCDCEVGLCKSGYCPACLNDDYICDEPHMRGIRGQAIDWSGVDGGWYCLVTDANANFHVNVRLTAPLPEEFPNRQLVTGLSILSERHSLTVEVANPYDVHTSGCPGETTPCLADGALHATVDGQEVDGLLHSSSHQYVADGIAVSASNLPVECRQFGGDKIWARMYDEMIQGRRNLAAEGRFEDWILRFDHMAAPDWCTKFITEHNIMELQSNHAIFKISTPALAVRLNVGTNFQGNGEVDWDGRVLPDLEFWQMDVGLDGLSVESESLSGILGETSRPVFDEDGHMVMKGYEALRGTVEDYRVSGPLGTDFALLSMK